MLRARRLTLLMAALLFVQWGSAFAHCLRLAPAAAAALHLEICTAQGLVSVVLRDAGETPEAAAADAADSGDRDGSRGDRPGGLLAAPCPVCLGGGGVAMLPAVPVVEAPVLLVQQADPPPPSSPAPTPPSRCTPPPPRAPPTS